jgi:hypothetical protein
MSLIAENFVYYIENKKLCIKQLNKSYKTIPALIDVIFNYDDEVVIIRDLHSKKPGKEYATHLIITACQQAKKRGILTVKLDDCSDRYRKKHNIYTKLGMKYDNEEGGPEMSGLVYNICNYKTITKKPFIYSLRINHNNT